MAGSRHASRPKRRELILKCSPRRPSADAYTYCVQASPNPEFASQPSNYAHWLLAHLFPLLSFVLNASNHASAPLHESRLYIAHGGNTVLPMWTPRYAELFEVDCLRSSAAMPEAEQTQQADQLGVPIIPNTTIGTLSLIHI